MVKWKKDSDLFFTINFKDSEGNVMDPLTKSFDIKLYTTNIFDYRLASYNKETDEFINCKINNNDANKLDIYIDKPDFNTGRLIFDIIFRTPNSYYSDNYFDYTINIKTDIQIIK